MKLYALMMGIGVDSRACNWLVQTNCEGLDLDGVVILNRESVN